MSGIQSGEFEIFSRCVEVGKFNMLWIGRFSCQEKHGMLNTSHLLCPTNNYFQRAASRGSMFLVSFFPSPSPALSL